MDEQLIRCVHWSLDNNLIDNAQFMAERLRAQRGPKDEEAAHLLAYCYYRQAKYRKAYEVLRKMSSAENRYLSALCAFRLGLLTEAEFALTEGKQDLNLVPNGSAGLYLLGQISRKQNQKTRAIQCFKKCLEINPYLWVAYEALCQLGEHIEASTFFGAPSDTNMNEIKTSLTSKPSKLDVTRPTQASKAKQQEKSTISTNVKVEAETPDSKSMLSTPALAKRLISSSLLNSPIRPHFSPATPANPTNLLTRFGAPTPSPFYNGTQSRIPIGGITPQPLELPVATPKQSTAAAAAASAEPQTPQQPSMPPPEARAPRRQAASQATRATAQATPRRTTRQTTAESATTTSAAAVANAPVKNIRAKRTAADSAKTTAATPSRTTRTTRLQRAISEPSVEKPQASQRGNDSDDEGLPHHSLRSAGPVSAAIQASEQATQEMDGAIALLSLLRAFGDAYRLLSSFRCQEAISAFESLPRAHYNTAWVLANVGKAQFEMAEYAKACQLFEEARRLEPWSTYLVELYSTALWHLRREIDLSFIANQITELDKECPESWCVVGNCFSLQKEHDTALAFFQRAIQLDPSFTYAHTLSGHECMANGQWEKAMTHFRNAIRLDPRHYNAWYGLGMIYFRQEKYSLAEYHFRRAVAINPTNSALRCYIGIVLHAQQRSTEALAEFDTAITLDPKNPLAKYKKAIVLSTMHQYQLALELLEEIVETSSREAPLYYVMGKLCKRMNMPDKALSYLTLALDLDTKNANVIKAAIDNLQQPDEDDNFELL